MRTFHRIKFCIVFSCAGLLVQALTSQFTGATSRAADLPDGYKLVTSTDAGQTLTTHKPATQSVLAVLQSVLPDLSHYFDGKPRIAGAYEDARDHRSGGASFTAMMKGEPVKGLVSCKLSDQGVGVAVIYAKATATADDWKKLTAATPGTTLEGPPLHAYNFPDGTGSVGLAQGWTTKAGSCNGGFVITGQADQQVTVGYTVSACTPNSVDVRQHQQMNALARQMGGLQTPMNTFIAPLTDPADVLSNLMPQISKRSQQHNGPAFALDNVKQVREIQAGAPGGKAALCRYGITISAQGQQKHREVLARVGLEPLGKGDFLLHVTSAAAPDATFQQDLPTMMAMIGSFRPNIAVISGQVHQQMENQSRWFDAQQASSKELSAAYDDYNKDIARNSTIQSRSNDNEDEIIRGVRTVEDTRTGEKQSVDLGNVDQIVDRLNYNEPGRYRQIPLRDEVDPLPPR
jgi:hypothetical protein